MLDFYRHNAELMERFVPVDSLHGRLNWTERIGGPNIHPLAVIGDPPQWKAWDGISKTPEIDPTTEIRAFCTVDAGTERATKIGPNGLIMASVHVGHDCQIGANVQIAPMSSLAGFVELGDNVKIGMGVQIRPYVKVGDNVHIGMGAVVTKDLPSEPEDGRKVPYVGSPARKLNTVSDLTPEEIALLPPSLR